MQAQCQARRREVDAVPLAGLEVKRALVVKLVGRGVEHRDVTIPWFCACLAMGRAGLIRTSEPSRQGE
jgi:hypothetical protein